MRPAAAIAVGTLAASLAVCSAAEVKREGMVTAPAGLYTPFLKEKVTNAQEPAGTSARRIDAFRIDVEPVTNAEFLDFVTTHPEWRKSRIKAVFADEGYLRRWPSDLDLVDSRARTEPVTNVSWFAAEAYCKARGLKLPTTDQWEYALADAGRGQNAVRQRSLEWLALPNSVRLPAIGAESANGFGVKDMVGLVWEWTLDFEAYAITSESRDPNGKDSASFCGGAAAGVTDPTDYPAFMRYAMRESLKANYTSDNLGFRCAGGAS
jgi:formylglycine-generating enzyme required for sulfatase activity